MFWHTPEISRHKPTINANRSPKYIMCEILLENRHSINLSTFSQECGSNHLDTYVFFLECSETDKDICWISYSAFIYFLLRNPSRVAGIYRGQLEDESLEKPRALTPTLWSLLQALDWLMWMSVNRVPREIQRDPFWYVEGFTSAASFQVLGSDRRPREEMRNPSGMHFVCSSFFPSLFPPSLFSSPTSSECSCCYNSTVFALRCYIKLQGSQTVRKHPKEECK